MRSVLFDALHPSRRELLIGEVPFLLFAVIVFVRTWVGYHRAKKRSHASPWEESVSHL